MGNSTSPAKFYANSDIKIENIIREFELDMGFFRYDFNFIFSKIFIENNNHVNYYSINYYSDKTIKIKNSNCEIISTNENLKQYYPLKIISFLDNAFFKTKDYKYYDAKKLQLFIFLISKDSMGKDADSYNGYQNKANFFFNSIVSEEKECANMILNSNGNYSNPNANQKFSAKNNRSLFEDKYLINKEDPNLLEFLKILIDISVHIVVDFYMNKKFILTGGYLENMKEYKIEIINKLIDLLFDRNTAKNSYFHVVFEDINSKFSKDKMFLTSGFIRLVGYPFICEYDNNREEELVEKARMCCFISY